MARFHRSPKFLSQYSLLPNGKGGLQPKPFERASVRAMCVAAKFGFCVQAAKKYAFLVLQMGQPLRLAMLGTSPYTGEARVGAATAPLQERQGTRGPLPYFGKIASDFTEIHLTLALLARLRPHRGRLLGAAMRRLYKNISEVSSPYIADPHRKGRPATKNH